MSNILVFFQHEEGSLAKASLCALNAANQIKEQAKKDKIIGVCLGKGASAAADEVLQYGLDEVHYSEGSGLEKYLAQSYSSVLHGLVSSNSADVIVAAASSTGKDFCPRLAAKLEAGQASDIISVNDDGSFRRPMYAGDIFADVEVLTDIKIITVRATAFAAAEKSSAKGEKKEISVSDLAEKAKVISYELSSSERPELGDAEVVVSGGRALQSEENFQKLMFPLADALGAAVGASRAAVDSGYAPNDWQVGQTGKVVAPNLYIAVGISGAIQHLAGMKDSKVIVAINKDADAPIFELADFGLVGDLYEILPELTEEIKKARGG